MNARSGLLCRDHSPKPACRVLMGLIEGHWWTGLLNLTTDPTGGGLTFGDYLGDDRLTGPGEGAWPLLMASGVS